MNKPRIQTKDSGFTIIEVVLVLAIAGLIFLMVFLALPALQRGQRDTGRKSDVSTVVSALQTYLSNHRGSFGSATSPLTSSALQDYIDQLGQYQKTDVVVRPAQSTSANPPANQIYVVTGAKCDDTSIPAPSSTMPISMPLLTNNVGSRQAAVVAVLENDGSKFQVYCQSL